MQDLQSGLITTEIKEMRTDINELLKHRFECELLHKQHEEHGRRRDDTTRQLTESNIILARSIADMTVNMAVTNELVEKVVNIIDVDNGAPEIKIVRNTIGAWKVFLIVGTTAGVIAGIIAAYTAIIGL